MKVNQQRFLQVFVLLSTIFWVFLSDFHNHKLTLGNSLNKEILETLPGNSNLNPPLSSCPAHYLNSHTMAVETTELEYLWFPYHLWKPLKSEDLILYTFSTDTFLPRSPPLA